MESTPTKKFRCGVSDPCCPDCAEFVGCMCDPFASDWPGWADPVMARVSAVGRTALRLRYLTTQLAADSDVTKFLGVAEWIERLDHVRAEGDLRRPEPETLAELEGTEGGWVVWDVLIMALSAWLLMVLAVGFTRGGVL